MIKIFEKISQQQPRKTENTCGCQQSNTNNAFSIIFSQILPLHRGKKIFQKIGQKIARSGKNFLPDRAILKSLKKGMYETQSSLTENDRLATDIEVMEDQNPRCLAKIRGPHDFLQREVVIFCF